MKVFTTSPKSTIEAELGKNKKERNKQRNKLEDWLLDADVLICLGMDIKYLSSHFIKSDFTCSLEQNDMDKPFNQLLIDLSSLLTATHASVK